MSLASVIASITAQNTGTVGLAARKVNLSISGTWSATVHLQRSFDAGSTWVDVESYTTNQQKVIDSPEDTVQYRLFCKTGNFTSGTIVCRLSY